MTIEERLANLEQRLQAAEDQLEIIRLINSYGPLVDSGTAEPAAHLWVEGGIYDIGGGARTAAYDDIAAIYKSEGHMALVNTGCSHLTATPRITVKGDTAEAVAYSFVVLREGDRWYVFRASINHFELVRTAEGWRIKERYNRVLDGSPDSHDAMRRVLNP